MTQITNPRLKNEQIKWFSILKAAEVSGLAAVTVGAYYVGLSILNYFGYPYPGWFLTWFVGVFSVLVLVGLGVLCYCIIAAWLKVNWKWAGMIAKRRLNKK